MREKIISEYQQEQLERIHEYEQQQSERKKKEQQRESYVFAMDLITSTIQKAKEAEQAERIVKFFMETLKIDLFGYTLISPLFPTGEYLNNSNGNNNRNGTLPFGFRRVVLIE